MQVLSASPAQGALRARIVAGLAIGFVFVGGGLVLGYLTLGTTFLQRFASVARPTPTETATGALAWAVALTAPALFMVVGLAKLYGVADLVGRARRRPWLARLAPTVPDDFVAAVGIRIHDGRPVPGLVLGPFGIAVVEELPPQRLTRHRGTSWEIRDAAGHWIPLENPLDRTSRDAERVRRWIGEIERDHVVKVYAAVVAPDESLGRTPTCAVVTPAQLPAWLASLPPQRTLTTRRREQLLDLMRTGL